MSLVRKKEESIPPETKEKLLDIIMADKEGAHGKLRLAARLMLERQ